jgi:hypothetical protein
MQSRLLFKIPEPGHDYNSPQSSHIWIELKRTDKNIIYECLKCNRHHQRKIKGQRKAFKFRKIRRIMTIALDGKIVKET